MGFSCFGTLSWRTCIAKRLMRRAIALAVLLVGAVGSNQGSARAQTILHKLAGDQLLDALGLSLAGAGDLDLDGFADFLVSAYPDGTGGSNGSVRAFSGRDASALYTWHAGPGYSAGFGRRLAPAGDVNADGVPDVIFGCEDHRHGRALVYSGADGSLLYEFVGDAPGDLFVEVSGAGDVDGDGFDDVIVGGRSNDAAGPNAGIAKVFSGRDGNVLYTLYGVGGSFGDAVAGVGDLDADGHADFAIGAATENTPNGTASGRVRVYSGRNASILWTWIGNNQSSGFGRNVAGAGDVDRDGVPDIVVSSTGDDTQGTKTGRLCIYSGATGQILREWTGTTPFQRFGGLATGLGDVDGDGYPDVGCIDALELAYILSGRDGSILHLIGPGYGSIYYIAGAGDVNGDGLSDLLTSSFPDSKGEVVVYSGGERRRAYCFGDGSGATCPCGNAAGAAEGCGNSSGAGGVLLSSGSTSLLSDDLVFTAAQLLPGQFALLFAGANPLNGGAGIPFGDGLRCVGGDLRRLGVRSPSPSGAASWGPALAGPQGWPTGRRCFQVWYRDPSPNAPCGTTFNLTHAIEIGYGF